MFCYNMIPLRNKPTREARHSSNVIDHIITNSAIGHNNVHQLINNRNLWDHFPIALALTTNGKTQKPVVKSSYNHSYCEKNIKKFKNTLHISNWDDIKKLKTSIRHINTFSISLLTFMTISLPELKLTVIQEPADPLDYKRYCKITKKETKTLWKIHEE